MVKPAHRIGKRLLGMVLVLLALAVPLGFMSARHQYEMDIHSGRERDSVTVFGIPLHWTLNETPLSQTLATARVVFPQAEWHPYHTAGGGARINYVYGGMHAAIRDLMQTFELMDLPVAERQRLARAALGCLETRTDFHVWVDFDEGIVRILGSGDRDIATYRR